MKRNSTKQLSTLMLALTLGSGMASASVNTQGVAAVYAVNDAAVDAHLQELLDQINALEADLNLCMAYANALGQAGQYSGQFSSLGQQIAGMRQTVNSLYGAGSLTADYELENYAAIASQIGGLKGGLTGAISSQIGSIMNGSFSQLNGLNSTIASTKQQVGEMGVADDFAERITALETKQKEALDKVTEDQNAIQTETDLVERLNKAKAVQEYVAGVVTEIQTEAQAIVFDAKVAAGLNAEANEAAYEKLDAQLDQLVADIATLKKEVEALAKIKGQQFAGQYGYQLAMLEQQANGMRGVLEQQYAAGRLSEDYVLDNYSNIAGQVAQLRQSFEGEIMGNINAIMSQLSPQYTLVENTITELKSELEEMGVADQFDARLKALKAISIEMWLKMLQYTDAIVHEADYAEKLNKAIEARDYFNQRVDLVNTERDAILTLAKVASQQKIAANQQAYETLGAEIDALKEAYDEAYAEYQALAPILGNGFAGQFGYQFAMLQNQVNGLRQQLETKYQNVELNAETVLDNYENTKGNIAQLKATMDQNIMGYVNNIVNNAKLTLNEATNKVALLEKALTDAGLAEEDKYAQTIADLNETVKLTNGNVDEDIEELGMADYIEKIELANDLKTYVDAFKEFVDKVYDDTIAEAGITVGIGNTMAAKTQQRDMVYDLNGRRVANPTKDGLYIVNGKKVVLK